MIPNRGLEQGGKFQPVPLEEVTTFVMIKSEGGGDRIKKQIRWNDLNSLEQKVVELIMHGKYGEASELTGDGKARTYNKNVLHNFLSAVALQNDPSLGWGMSNDYVRTITG